MIVISIKKKITIKLAKFLKWIFSILLILNITSCIDSNLSKTDNNKIKIEKDVNWIEIELQKQFDKRSKKDSVDIFGLPIKKLPDYFYDDDEIKYLRVDCIEPNCMTEISPKISRLVNLETLILSKTSIRELPKEIGELSKLKELRILGGGQLESLPKEISKLNNLEILDIWRNRLQKIPVELRSLEKLKIIFVGENNFTKSYLKELKLSFPNVKIELYR